MAKKLKPYNPMYGFQIVFVQLFLWGGRHKSVQEDFSPLASRCRLFSKLFEEVCHQLATFLLEQSSFHCGFRMNRAACGVEVTEKTPFRVGSAVDYTSDLAPSERAGAHGAGLHRDV